MRLLGTLKYWIIQPILPDYPWNIPISSSIFLTSESSFYDSLMSVRPSPQKTCEIVTNYYDFSMNVRDIKILNNTTKYCLIFHRIAQYRPVLFHIVQYSSILSNNVQYFPILFNIVHVAILALSCPSCYIVMTIKHCLILSSISLHSPVLTNIGKWCPLYMFFALDL